MTMSSIGLPALNGFIGEFLILQGVFVANKVWAGFAASGIVLGAAYMLWLYQRRCSGKVENPKNEKLQDLDRREFATFAAARGRSASGSASIRSRSSTSCTSRWPGSQPSSSPPSSLRRRPPRSPSTRPPPSRPQAATEGAPSLSIFAGTAPREIG